MSLAISLMIFASAIPLTKKSGRILLEAAPSHLDLTKITEDLLTLPGVQSIHDLHIWHLSQNDLLCSFHVVVPSATTLSEWEKLEGCFRDCMAAYGVSHVTVGPEISENRAHTVGESAKSSCNELLGCAASETRLRKPTGRMSMTNH